MSSLLRRVLSRISLGMSLAKVEGVSWSVVDIYLENVQKTVEKSNYAYDKAPAPTCTELAKAKTAS